jgi:regulator of sirC expression with transglutaminase-like and TPR domain
MYQTISDLDYFRMLVQDAQTTPLLESAIVLGRMAYPELDLQQVQADVDALAAQLAQACRSVSTERSRLSHALQWFYGTHGFAGNAQQYYDADNSYLHRVIATRRGIPISLAVLFTELTRHIGLELSGVAFPGHFLIRADLHEGVVIIDPFTGASLDRESLVQRAAPYGVDPERLLGPASAPQILMRMLNNLQAIYAQQGRDELLEHCMARLRILQEAPSN